MILCFRSPSNPRRLWDQFSDALSADLLYKAKQSGLYTVDDPQAQFNARVNALFISTTCPSIWKLASTNTFLLLNTWTTLSSTIHGAATATMKELIMNRRVRS
ncbi:hypothetical protein K457DRAFT_23585 [Linnemannia elongata AG-77]|uniref:Uncharacterized protein n=1 Tax=Linnemannia elongata AG-77 TaxID=1314771 RepID=A0A197JKH3_9FUNG|nr:hypothetical protein K457DRAFT_23585 [Linnemannia elongata AG-77]